MVVVHRSEDSYGLNTLEWIEEIVNFYGDEADKRMWKNMQEVYKEYLEENDDILQEQNRDYDRMIAQSLERHNLK